MLGSSAGGVVARLGASDGVDPPVGELDAGDFRVAGELALRGSAEC